MLLLGAHMSVSGGLHNAIAHATAVDSEAVQVFTKNQNQWAAKELTDELVAKWKDAWQASKIQTVVAHDSYLINLASPTDELWEKSIAAFRIELERCERLGIPYLVTHPGAHTGSGADAGVARVVAALDRVHADLPGYTVRTLLETTAGQGTTLGATFEELATMQAGVSAPERLGVCFDTCHTFVAGYDCRTADAFAATMDAFDATVGIGQIEAIHFNDALKELGSKRDRHAHIGKGCIGSGGFWNFMNDARLDGKAGLLETEKGADLAEDREALTLLRSLVGAPYPESLVEGELVTPAD